MTVIAVTSLKGSPGVTTLTLALAYAWPTPRTIALAEVDPTGGDVADAWQLPPEPSLATLAAAARHGAPAEPFAHVHRLGDATVLAAPASTAATRAALTSIGDRLPELLRGLADDVVADCGRIDAERPPVIATAADVVVLMTDVRAASVLRAGWAVDTLRRHGSRVVLAVSGETTPEVREDITRITGTDVATVVPRDWRCAAALMGGPARERWLSRAPLVRAARDLADAVDVSAPPPVAVATTEVGAR